MGPGRAFGLAILVGAAGMLALVVLDRAKPTSPPVRPDVSHRLSSDVSVSTQVTLDGIAILKAAGYRTVIDMRPDGEAKDQTPSAAVATATRAAGLEFVYLPTPHGNIPDAIPEQLAQTLASAPKPIMLYCRSGNRASRAWALAEASRPGGPSPAEISTAVKSAGLSVDDLMPRLAARAQARLAQQ